MSMLERLKEYLESKDISTGAAEKACGFGNAMLRNAFVGGKGIGSDKIEKILHTYPELSAEWLLRGVGSMIIGQENDKAKELENKIIQMSVGRDSKDAAYDVILSIADMITKTYKFFENNSITTKDYDE